MSDTLYCISSQGRTATTWLTVALNSHEELACAHGPTLPLAFRDIHEGGELLKEKQSESAWGEGGQRFRNATLRDMMDEGASRAPGKRIVLVHAISAYELRHRIVNEGFTGTVRAANLVRHPVTRVQSYTSHFIRSWRRSQVFREDMAAAAAGSTQYQRWSGVARELGLDVDGDSATMLWVMALSWIANDFSDLDMRALHVPYERLVSDVDYFGWFLRELFGDDLRIVPGYLRQVMEIGQVNETSGRKSAVEIHAEWDSPRRTLFKLFAAENHLRQRYAPFQYDFSFVFEGEKFFV